jgi:N-carbamoylputrescine amidase
VIARAAAGEDAILYADLDLAQAGRSHARQLFLRDRRPDLYAAWIAPAVGRR